MWRVISFLYAESRQHFYNLAGMHQKPLACFGLRMGMVPKAYHWSILTILSMLRAWCLDI
jgi:hypothetical protein